MRYDVDRVVGEISAAADEFLRPRFRCLGFQDVREKSAGEVVTVADEECEAELGPALMASVPGSVLVGEEAAARDPALINQLSGTGPVWLLDPLDGTSAFIEGSPDYAIMAALIVDGVTVLSVIHQPEHELTYVAVEIPLELVVPDEPNLDEHLLVRGRDENSVCSTRAGIHAVIHSRQLQASR